MAEVIGECALCREKKELQLSHIIPKFVGRYLKQTSIGNIRSQENPDKPVQDIEKHYISFIHVGFMIFRTPGQKQKVVSHHLMRQSLLYFFNHHFIYFCYFFHCLRYPRLRSGSISQKFC